MLCKTCKGLKQVTGMGMMREDCPTCSGKGFIKSEPKIESKSVTPKKRLTKKHALEMYEEIKASG